MRGRPGAVAVIAGVVLIAGGASWATGSTAGNYRTAAVIVADVEQTLTLTGTVASSTRRDLSFGVSGTIKGVAVTVGDQVTAGQRLGRLDPEDLDAALTRARADLARAKAQLETDQIAQTATVTSAITTSSAAETSTLTPASSASSTAAASSPASASSPTAAAAVASIAELSNPAASNVTNAGSGDGSEGSTELDQALETLAEQQDAVTSAQSAASEAIATAKAALEAQAAACVVDDGPVADENAPENEDVPEDGDTPEDNGSDLATSTPVDPACADALAVVQAGQDEVAVRQATLQAALTALNDTLTEAITTLAEAEPESPPESNEGTGENSPSTAPQDGAGQDSGSAENGDRENESRDTESQENGDRESEKSESTAPSANDSDPSASERADDAPAGSLASDQAAIDTAQAELTEAELARDAATMTAPFAGTVLDVGFASGDDVSADDVAVVIVGDGGSTVSTTVTATQVAQVAMGQTAHVTPAGADEPVDGTVTQIGILPSTTDTVAYPVLIDLADDIAAPEGVGASVEIVTSTVEGALTVPSSAVANTGRTSVTVLEEGVPSTVPVTVGVVGPSRTSIAEGLEVGQEVVLADLDAPLPGADTETTTGPGGLGERPGGAGIGGRGVRPGGPN